MVVDLPAQVFAAYEHGYLVRWGPVSSGKADTPTPSGEFRLNWRAVSRRSSINRSWLLEWYFNIHNTRGIAFHKYALPDFGAPRPWLSLEWWDGSAAQPSKISQR